MEKHLPTLLVPFPYAISYCLFLVILLVDKAIPRIHFSSVYMGKIPLLFGFGSIKRTVIRVIFNYAKSSSA